MIEEISKVVSGGITADEMAGAKQGILSGFERNLSNDGFVLGISRTGSTSTARWSSGPSRTRRSPRFTVDQVNAALKRHIKPGSLVKITAGDKKKL